MNINILLPNLPELPQGVEHCSKVSTATIIELNGNHWRKILTIIAKLVADDEEDWRIVRDHHVWERARIVFSTQALNDEQGWVMVVGKSFEGTFPIPDGADVIGEQHRVYHHQRWLWTPYLDYRQFPNQLIADVRRLLHRQD